MIRYILIFLLVTNLYLYIKLCSGFGNGWWKVFYLAWAALGAVAPFASRMGFFGAERSEVTFALSFTWVAIVGMACVGFLIMDAAALIVGFSDFFTGAALKARLFAPRRCVPVTLLLICSVVAYSYYEAWNVRTVHLVVETPKLPEGVDELRLVHLTDIHLGGLYTAERLSRLMELVRLAEPDIVVMTGDLVDGDMTSRAAEAKLLQTHRAKYGAFEITGNHDFYSGIDHALDFTKRAGFVVLRNARADAAGITIIGLDDPAGLGRMVIAGEEKLPGNIYFPKDRFVLLLKHRPQVIKESEGKFDLQMSGHTHGGQIWPFNHVVQAVNKHVQHLSRNGKSAVYVSNGAGFWGPPLRFLAPPELTVVHLRRGMENSYTIGN